MCSSTRAGAPLTSTSARLSSHPSRSVELSPGNSRRIFASTDILADPDTVWDLLTDYDNLAEVVPNLLSNEVRVLRDALVRGLARR